jgi:hypothetical protein
VDEDVEVLLLVRGVLLLLVVVGGSCCSYRVVGMPCTISYRSIVMLTST